MRFFSRFFRFFCLIIIFSLASVFVSSGQFTSSFLQRFNYFRRSTVQFAPAHNYSVEKLQQKWNELRPFFQTVQKDFSGALPDKLHFGKEFTSGTKKRKTFYIGILLMQSDRKTFADFPQEALLQLQMLLAYQVQLKDLEVLFASVHNSLSDQVRLRYYNAFKEYHSKLLKFAGSGTPYLTVNDGHFRILAIVSSSQENLHSDLEFNKEIRNLLLAKTTPETVDEYLLEWIPKSITLWKEIQPYFYRWDSVDTLLPLRTNPDNKLVVFPIWGLQWDNEKTDYYKLSPVTKSQLQNLVVKGITAKQVDDKIRLNQLVWEGIWDKRNTTTESKTLDHAQRESNLQEINTLLQKLTTNYPEVDEIPLSYQKYVIFNQDDHFFLILYNHIVASDDAQVKELKQILTNYIKDRFVYEDAKQVVLIGVGITGGLVFIIGFSAFLYWFLRIRKKQ